MEACWCLRSAPSSPWQLHFLHHSSRRRFPPSPHPRFPTLCSADGLHESRHKPPPQRASRLQTDWLVPNSDPGWTLGESQPDGGSIAGWVKAGGAIFLAIGFALGTRSIYLKKELVKEFAAPLPGQEQLMSSSTPSDSSGTVYNVDKSSLMPDFIEDQSEYVKQDNKLNVNDFVSEVPQGDFTSSQVSLSTENVEGDSFTLSSLAEIMPIEKDNVSFKNGFPGSATADLGVNLPPTKDAVQEGGVVHKSIEPFVEGNRVVMGISDDRSVCPYEDITPEALFPFVEGNQVAMDVSEDMSVLPDKDIIPEALFPLDSTASLMSTLVTSGMAISNKSDLSSLSCEKELTGEGAKMSELSCDLNDLSSVSVDKDTLPPSEAMKLQEPAMPDALLHDDVGGVQNVTHPKGFGSSIKENRLEKNPCELDHWDVKNADVELFPSALQSEWQCFLPAFTSAPSAALQKMMGRVVVPALVDHMQEQALAALEALKVIEADVEPGAICTRREYARWLIKASATLSRSPAHKVFPAMYIENASTLAYDDVSPEDPDFPSIQGLAEAGLISSRLLTHDAHNQKGSEHSPDENNNTVFLPDSPLTRQDLITWKLALERQPSKMPIGKEVLREISGFIDLDRIHQDAWPALAADVSSGERSIMSLAFGYTRRFQPEKPVTKAQAAIALATHEAWECVSEEVARLEADSIAEAAVVAELVLETKAKQEVAAAYNELLGAEREKRKAAASTAEKIHAELEKLKAEWEEERGFLLKERAALDSEKVSVSMLRHRVEEQALALSSAKLEVAFERQKVEKLCREAEEEKQTINKVQSELEIEKNSLLLARVWAEDESRKAFGHAKALKQARKGWEDQGVQLHVEKELDEAKIARTSWHSEEVQSQQSALNGLATKSRGFGQAVVDALLRFWQSIWLIFVAIRNRVFSIIGKLDEDIHEAMMKSIDRGTKTVEGIQQTVSSSAAGLASVVREGTQKVVDECREGAERLSRKFKIS